MTGKSEIGALPVKPNRCRLWYPLDILTAFPEKLIAPKFHFLREFTTVDEPP